MSPIDPSIRRMLYNAEYERGRMVGTGLRTISRPPTKAELDVAWAGSRESQTPPADVHRVTIDALCDESCATARWLVAALRKLNASVWVSGNGGDQRITARGRVSESEALVAYRAREGEMLSFSANGPDAEKALSCCQEMLGAPPDGRRGIYRRRFVKGGD